MFRTKIGLSANQLSQAADWRRPGRPRTHLDKKQNRDREALEETHNRQVRLENNKATGNVQERKGRYSIEPVPS